MSVKVPHVRSEEMEKRLFVFVFFHVDLEANVRFIVRTFSAECLRVSPASVSSLSSSSDFLPVKSAPLKQHRGHFRGFCSTSAGDLISGMLFEAAPPSSSLLPPFPNQILPVWLRSNGAGRRGNERAPWK